MKLMETLSLIIFFLVTGVHLYASWKKDRSLRNKTKPFILLSLLAYYCFGADTVSLTVVAALLFSWLGDVLLIGKGVKWFTVGGISFMISHFFFILSYAQQTVLSQIPIWLILLLAAVFTTSTVIIFSHLRPHLPKALFYPMFLYLMINGAMNCFAWFRSLTLNAQAGLITAVGALLFYISDCSLFFVRFKKDSRLKTHFLVMLTYSIGEFLIVAGLMQR